MRAHLFLLKPSLTGGRLGREHDEPLDQREGWYDHAATLEVEPHDSVEDTLDAVYHGRSTAPVTGPGTPRSGGSQDPSSGRRTLVT